MAYQLPQISRQKNSRQPGDDEECPERSEEHGRRDERRGIEHSGYSLVLLALGLAHADKGVVPLFS